MQISPTLHQWWEYQKLVISRVFKGFKWYLDLAWGVGLTVATQILQWLMGLVPSSDWGRWVATIIIPLLIVGVIHIAWRALRMPVIIDIERQQKILDLETQKKDRFSKNEKLFAFDTILITASNLRDETINTENDLDEWIEKYKNWKLKTEETMVGFGMYAEGTIFSCASSRGAIKHPPPVKNDGFAWQQWCKYYDEALSKELETLNEIVKNI